MYLYSLNQEQNSQFEDFSLFYLGKNNIILQYHENHGLIKNKLITVKVLVDPTSLDPLPNIPKYSVHHPSKRGNLTLLISVLFKYSDFI